MIANHIHDALAQVRQIQQYLIEKRLFRGYSGRARLACAGIVAAGVWTLAGNRVPADPKAHLVGWGIVCGLSVLVNYACVLHWFLFDTDVRRNPVMLKPALDALPALAVGAALSVALVLAKHYDLLFGVWMCLYGLAQVAYRHSLPHSIYLIGLGYVVCGAYCLLSPGIVFTDPLPMGIVFCAGEVAGGVSLLRCRGRSPGRDGSVGPDRRNDGHDNGE